LKKLQTRFNSTNESPGFLLWKAANLHQRLQREALKKYDLTPTQFALLATYYYLQNDEGHCTQALVCEHTGMDKMLVSDVTKTLLKKKMLLKKKNVHDARSFLIEVTKEGRALSNKTVKIIEDLDEKIFSHVKDLKRFMKDLNSLSDFETDEE
jgi:MarR family transcriptional regulator, organic hydroperoxide resistance regulator